MALGEARGVLFSAVRGVVHPCFAVFLSKGDQTLHRPGLIRCLWIDKKMWYQKSRVRDEAELSRRIPANVSMMKKHKKITSLLAYLVVNSCMTIKLP